MSLHTVIENEQWLKRFRDSHARTSCREHDPAFGPVFVRGLGARLWDVDGREWIDLTCGFSATNFGHCDPVLASFAARQLLQLTHLTSEPHIYRIQLAERLIQKAGGRNDGSTKVIFNSSGARAIESAWKAASSFRPGKLLVLAPSFHGRTIATAALSDTARVQLSSILEDQVLVQSARRYPYCAQCPVGLRFPACQLQCQEDLIHRINQQPELISAILVEPALTARGYVFPPAEFFQRLRNVAARHGILVMADEVQTGLGRCGSFRLCDRQGWQPDLTVLGKSLGGGIMPIAAVVGRADVLDSLPSGAESETGAGSPLACAIAIRTIEYLEEHNLYAAGEKIGESLRSIAESEMPRLALTARVEGQGASCAIEFYSSSLTVEVAAHTAKRFAESCVENLLRVHLTGPNGTRVVMLPPLTLSQTELAEAECRLRRVFRDRNR